MRAAAGRDSDGKEMCLLLRWEKPQHICKFRDDPGKKGKGIMPFLQPHC